MDQSDDPLFFGGGITSNRLQPAMWRFRAQVGKGHDSTPLRIGVCSILFDVGPTCLGKPCLARLKAWTVSGAVILHPPLFHCGVPVQIWERFIAALHSFYTV